MEFAGCMMLVGDKISQGEMPWNVMTRDSYSFEKFCVTSDDNVKVR